MIIFLILGILNGFCITLSRVLNGQLSTKHGVFHASLVNHVIGFIFLSALYLFISEPLRAFPQEPVFYLGGVIGALYVAINSFVMLRLGATNSIILVVSGQMLFGLVMEIYHFGSENLGLQVVGAMLVVLGVCLKGHWKVSNKAQNAS